jgi:hypothetical protein
MCQQFRAAWQQRHGIAPHTSQQLSFLLSVATITANRHVTPVI